MEFSRIGKHTVKCVISEQEILDLGYTLDDIMSNGKRTQEFMNHIFDLAEQKFQMNFEMGVRAVRADFLPNRSVAFTFSENNQNEGSIADRLKDLVGSLIESLIPAKKEEAENTDSITDFKMPEGVKIMVMFLFEEMDILNRFAKLVSGSFIPCNALYKFEDTYFLLMDLTDSTEEDVKRLSCLVDEYASDIVVGADKMAFIEEHGLPIIKEQAIETLSKL